MKLSLGSLSWSLNGATRGRKTPTWGLETFLPFLKCISLSFKPFSPFHSTPKEEEKVKLLEREKEDLLPP